MEHLPVDNIQGLGNLLLGLGVFIGSVVQVLNYLKVSRNAKNIAELTTNTNGIREALIVATGKAERALGREEGRKETK